MNRDIVPFPDTTDTSLATVEGQWHDVEPEPLSIEDYNLLKQGLARTGRAAYRNVLICRTLFGTGLRLAEVLRLTPSNIHREGLDVSVRLFRSKKKNAKPEFVPLHPELASAIISYIQMTTIPPDRSIFNVTPRTVQLAFKKASLAVLHRPAHPHQLRSLYINYLVKQLGLPIELAGKMVGHEDVRTTQKHYLKLTMQERDEVNRRLPV